MSGPGRYASVLRWYPAPWRNRYGDELVALLEDTYEGAPIPLRSRLSLVRAGSVERLNHRGIGPSGRPLERVRSGSLLVLCAWAAMVVAGSAFAKTSEHWDASTPRADRSLPAAGYVAVQWAALVGSVVVATAAALCLPPFLRRMRQGGWAQVRRPILRAVAFTTATGLAGLGAVLWAHHLTEPQRNGADWRYSMVAVLGAVLVAATVASWVAAAVDTVVTLRIPVRTLRACASLALLLTLAMVVVFGGTVTWWWSVAVHAPGFFGRGPTGRPTDAFPVPLAAAGLLMVAGLGTAACGTWRVLRSLPALRRA